MSIFLFNLKSRCKKIESRRDFTACEGEVSGHRLSQTVEPSSSKTTRIPSRPWCLSSCFSNCSLPALPDISSSATAFQQVCSQLSNRTVSIITVSISLDLPLSTSATAVLLWDTPILSGSLGRSLMGGQSYPGPCSHGNGYRPFPDNFSLSSSDFWK